MPDLQVIDAASMRAAARLARDGIPRMPPASLDKSIETALCDVTLSTV